MREYKTELNTRTICTLCPRHCTLCSVVLSTTTLESRSRLSLLLGGGKDATYVVYWSVTVYIVGHPNDLTDNVYTWRSPKSDWYTTLNRTCTAFIMALI